MEIVRASDIIDVYRLRPGVLLTIHKYRKDPAGLAGSRAHVSRESIQGLNKNSYARTLEEYSWDKHGLLKTPLVFPAGSIIVDSVIFMAARSYEDYWYELTTSDPISGDLKDFESLSTVILDIMSQYRA